MKIREKIIQKLKKIEQEQNIEILFAIESGSRAWGFESTDSDYDVRFIYRHPKNHYLSISKKRDVVEYPINDELDLSGWDIRKALQLFLKSNPALFEWIGSPITYLERTDFRKDLKELEKIFFSPRGTIYHYLNMAKGNYRSYLQKDKVRLKKYFYVLRPILACLWIEKYNQKPPMEFEIKVNEFLKKDKELYKEVQKLLKKKKSGTELDNGKKIEVINDFIKEKLEYFDEYVLNTPKSNPKNEILDNIFRKYISLEA